LVFKLLKVISGSKLVITCHDVARNSGWDSEMKYRKQIFHHADFLLVHTEKSVYDLINLFSINKKQNYRTSFSCNGFK